MRWPTSEHIDHINSFEKDKWKKNLIITFPAGITKRLKLKLNTLIEISLVMFINRWMELSITYANQRNYLDDLYKVYPIIPEGIRSIDKLKWRGIERAYNDEDKEELLKLLLSLDLFPVKDSYVAYLKRDKSAIDRNPETVNRLYGRLRELGIDKIWERSSEPKETNRQIGPLFKRWVNSGVLGPPLLNLDAFNRTNENAILVASDREMQSFAKSKFGYNRNKGLDFVARFNQKYVIGEAKFLTDFGGHQNAQFEDALSTLNSGGSNVISIAILDGVVYIKGKNKMYKTLTEKYQNSNIMSALVLREFLFQL